VGQGIPQSDPSSQHEGLLSLDMTQNLELAQQAVAFISRPSSSLVTIWKKTWRKPSYRNVRRHRRDRFGV